jgi:hypothetical protein
LVDTVALETYFGGLPVRVRWSAGASAPSVNTWTDPRYHGGARILGDSSGVCTEGFHVQRGSAVMTVTAAHCGMADPGTWRGTGSFPAFGSMSRFLPNEIYDKGSVTAIAHGLNCASVTQSTTWTPVAHGQNWQAWSDAALTSMTIGFSQGRVWDPTHGYIRVRETVIPFLNDWVMKYGAYLDPQPTSQQIVQVTEVHALYQVNMTLAGDYRSPAAPVECWRAYVHDSFKTSCNASIRTINGDSGGPVTSTVWRSVPGVGTVAVALPVGIVTLFSWTAADPCTAVWGSYMWNINNVFNVQPIQGT